MASLHVNDGGVWTEVPSDVIADFGDPGVYGTLDGARQAAAEVWARWAGEWRLAWSQNAPPPPPVGALVFSAWTSVGFTVSWTLPADTDLIEVLVDATVTATGQALPTVTLPANATSYTFTNAPPSRRIDVAVRFRDTGDNLSDPRTGSTYTLATKPRLPSIGANDGTDKYPVTFTFPAEGDLFHSYRVRHTTNGTDPHPSGGTVTGGTASPIKVAAGDNLRIGARVYAINAEGRQGDPSDFVTLYTTRSDGPTLNSARTETSYGRLVVRTTGDVGTTHVQVRTVQGSTTRTGSVVSSAANTASVIAGHTAGAVSIQARQETAGGWGPWVAIGSYTMQPSSQTLAAVNANSWTPFGGGAWCLNSPFASAVWQGVPDGSPNTINTRGLYFYGATGIRDLIDGRQVLDIRVRFWRLPNVGCFCNGRLSLAISSLASAPACGPGAAPSIAGATKSVVDATGAAADFVGNTIREVRVPAVWLDGFRTGAYRSIGAYATDGTPWMEFAHPSSGNSAGRVTVLTTG